MLFAVVDRRSPFNALAAWLCIAVHLLVVSASGWHTHGHARGDDSGLAAPHGALPAASAAPADQSPGSPVQSDREPDGCGLCKAIIDLGHASLVSPITLAQPVRIEPGPALAARRPVLSPVLRTHLARGPPPLRSAALPASPSLLA